MNGWAKFAILLIIFAFCQESRQNPAMASRWIYGDDGVAVFPDEAHYDRYLSGKEESQRRRNKILCELHRRDLKREHPSGWHDITPAEADRIAKVPEGEMPRPETAIPSSGDWLEGIVYVGRKTNPRKLARRG